MVQWHQPRRRERPLRLALARAEPLRHLDAFSSAPALELEGTGIRSTVSRPGPAISEYAAGWDPKKIESLLRRWQHYGLQRNSGVMPSEAVAQAVVAAINTPPGVRLDLIEVQPEGTHGPPES